MTVQIVALLIPLLMTSTAVTASHAAETNDLIRWDKLASLPDREGFAGSFAGVNHGALIVAGGANFPEKRPWEGGTKVWYDSVFVLEKPDGQWKSGGKLPHPLGYGVSITHASGLICIGGSDTKEHRRDVFSFAWINGKRLRTKILPGLPKCCANMCGALLGNTIYVAGGLEKPDSTNTLNTFWSFDLTKPTNGWKELEPWPGPDRMLAVAGVQDGAFYLFGGASLKNGPDNKPVREWLRDAYRFTPGKGWKRMADLPRPAVAAPSPAPAIDKFLLVLGGDDGAQVSTAPTKHVGFPRDILAYDTVADAWTKQGEMPFGLVTTSSAHWNGKIIIPGGEQKPGVRSTEVWAGTLKK